MRKRKINLKKILFILCILVILVVIGIIIGKKINNNYKIDKEELMVQEKINGLFIFEDLTLNYDSIRKKYGMGTDNFNGENVLFGSTYNSKFDKFNVIKIFYYNKEMNVEKIEIYNYENSKYEVLNYLTEYLGDPLEYNNEIKELATEYKWKYDKYDLILKDNVDSNSIILKNM